MQGLDSLVNLERLYLERNCIQKLEGLTRCRKLKELVMNDQKNNGNFEFDEYSLAAISESITYLDMSYCGIVNAKQLFFLENVTKLKLNNNNIRDLHGDVL
jgi:Leucine-rich repeat (LRR) protein